MKKSKEQVERYKTRIREIMIPNPDATIDEIVEVLTKQGLPLHRNYVGKLRDKILNDETAILSKKNIQRVGRLANTLKQTGKKLWKIILSGDATNTEIINAIKELKQAEIDFIKVLQTIPGTNLDKKPEEIILKGEISASDDMIEKVAESWAEQFNPTTKPVIYQEPTAEEAVIIEPKQINEPIKPDTRSANQKIIDAQRGDNPSFS
jgi:hypothetical protein